MDVLFTYCSRPRSPTPHNVGESSRCGIAIGAVFMEKSIAQVDIFARPQLIVCVVGSIDDVTIACNAKNTSMIAILRFPA